MKILMVANDNGKMPKKCLKTLCKLTDYDWKYDDECSKSFIAEIEELEHAKFAAMKIIAALTPEVPCIFCCYAEDRKAIFYYDRLEYREV